MSKECPLIKVNKFTHLLVVQGSPNDYGSTSVADDDDGNTLAVEPSTFDASATSPEHVNDHASANVSVT